MITFVIGLFIGVFIGVCVMCLCNAASNANKSIKNHKTAEETKKNE